jgi:hypothetical protein
MTESTDRSTMRHLILALAALALGVTACEGCRSSQAPGTVVPAAAVATPTLRLYLATDVAGALEPCGCTRDQLGGLGHLGAWMKQNHVRAPASLFATSGPLFFMDEKLDAERGDQDRAKAHAIALVVRGLEFAAFAPGTNDWADGSSGLTALAAESGGAVFAGDLPSPPLAASVVRDYGGLRIGLVGSGSPGPGASPSSAEEAVKRGVADAKRQGANVLVALAAVGRGEAKRIADAVPELAAVVVGSSRTNGDGNTTAPQVEEVGDVLIVQAANHLQSVAVLDLYLRESPVPGRLVKFADATGIELARERAELTTQIDDLHVKIAAWQRDPSIAPKDVEARSGDLARLEARRDTLDTRRPPERGSFFRYSIKEVRESFGSDPAIEADMRAYYKAVNDHNRAAFADRLPPPRAPGQAGYVGVEACSSCHAAARQVWNGTPHAHAYATLSSQFKEFNLECVGCHVTGYEKPGGSTVTHVDKLENVECEVCHGPGSKHVSNPGDSTLIVAKPDASMCLSCHHPPHVEGFDALAKMKEVLGPGHGMPAN